MHTNQSFRACEGIVCLCLFLNNVYSNILRIGSANPAYHESQRKQFCHLMNKLSTLYIYIYMKIATKSPIESKEDLR